MCAEAPSAVARVVEDWARVPDLTPDTEPRIVWSSTTTGRTDWAIVYLHGFSATRQELAPLPERVAERLSAHLFEARLSGHGLPGEALADVSAETWLRDTREAIRVGRALGRRVAVLAASTGATLAAVDAAHAPEASADAYVFLSPNFGPADRLAELLSWPWADRWLPLITSPERSWTPDNEAHGRYWTTRYPVGALFPMMAAVEAARGAPLERVEAPLRIFVHPEDPVVSPEASWAAFGRWGSANKRMTPVDGPGDLHVLAGRILAPERTERLAETIAAWLRALGPAAGGSNPGAEALPGG